MANRLLLESDVIRVVDKHTTNDKLDNDISCILEEVNTATVELPSILLERKVYDKEGTFQREVTIDVKDDYKVGLCNGK